MTFAPFELEEWQSKYETEVKLNLADSGCHPAPLSMLLRKPEEVQALLDLSMHYPPVGKASWKPHPGNFIIVQKHLVCVHACPFTLLGSTSRHFGSIFLTQSRF